MNSSTTLSFLRLAMTGTLSLATLSVFADQSWKGTSDNQWTTTGNWSGGAIPGSTDNVIYNGTSTANLSNWLSTAVSINGIVFTNPAGSVSINSASTLTNGAGGINMSNATQIMTINAQLALGANQIWVVATNQTLNVSGPVSGSAGVYKDGFGTLVLSGTNNFSGNFTNNGGPVWINNSAALGGGSKTVYVVNNLVGAGLHLNGTNGNISLASGINFTLSQQNGAIFNEAGDNVINGNMSVNSGGGYVYILANAGSLTLNGGITLAVTARPITLGGMANGTNNGGIASSTGFPFRKVDSGTWTFTGNNSYNGYTTIEDGTLALGPNGKIGSTTNITVFANATLDVSAVTNATGPNAFVLTANQVLAGSGTVVGNVDASAAGVIIQPGSLNIAQTAGGMGSVGTLTISSNLTMGATTTNYFELNPDTTPGSGINDLIGVGGNLDPQGGNISIGTLNGLVNGIYRLFNYSGSKLSSFNAIVLNPSSLRGTFTIDESVPGQINLVVSGIINPVWAGTGSSSTWDLNTTADWNGNNVKFLNGDIVTFDDAGNAPIVNLSGTLHPGWVTFNNSTVNYTLATSPSGKITGPTGLAKSGSGMLTITSNTNDFTGPVTINGGILTVTNFSPSGAASPIGAGSNIVLNGGTFQFSGATRPAAGTVNRSWTLGPNGGTFQSTAATFFMSNQISGPGSLTKSGSQQIILGDLTAGLVTAGNNTYAGNTYITQGELQIRNTHALGYGKAVITAGADLAVGGQTNYGTITNNIDLNGYDTGGLGTIEIGDNNTGITFGGTLTLLGNSSVGSKSGATGLSFGISGSIVGSGSLTKLQSSAFTCTLGGSNTYSGNTIITAGTLAVGIAGAGSINNSPNISVGKGAKLQLNAGGSLASAVNISLATGGYMDVNGLGAGITYTLGSSATLNASGTGTTSGTTQSEIHSSATGTVSLGSRPILLTFTPTTFTDDTTHPPLVISQGTLQLSGNVITINNAAGTALGVGTYRLIQVTSGTIIGTPNATPFIIGKGLAAGNTGVISVSSGNVILTVSSTSPTATTTTLNAFSASSYGSSVTFTASVSPTPTGGTVQFYDNGVTIGSPATVNSGTASYTTSALWAGSHSFTAAYSGTSGYGASATAVASTQTVNPVALSITATGDTKTYGQTKTYGAGSSAFTSSGLQNSDVISSVTIIASGGTAADAPVGSYNLTPSAPVGGGFNANNYTVTYNTGTFSVVQAAPGLSLASSLNPAGYLATVDFAASVFATNATGTVVFQTNGVAFSTNAVSEGGAISSSMSTLLRGTNLITAIYSGDGNLLAGTNSLSQIITNHPPVATDATYYRAKGLSLKIAITNLLSNVTDVDGDTISLQSVGIGLTNATIMADSTYVYYLPTNDAGSNDNDVVNYTVSDGFGGTATTNILINVYSAAGPAELAIPSNGVVNITFFGIPNYTYVVQTTTNLAGPWWILSTNTAGTNGVWQFTDPNATNAQQYYRSAQP